RLPARLFLRRHHQRIRRHAGLFGSNPAARPLGHRRLHPRAATQPKSDTSRCPSRQARRTGRRPPMTPELVADVDRFSQRALTIGAAGLALCVVGWFLNPDQFFRAYLVGFLFWNGVALGCLAIAMLHQLSGGAWGVVIRRILESATRTFPVTAVL